jgi:hypothetical protein
VGKKFVDVLPSSMKILGSSEERREKKRREKEKLSGKKEAWKEGDSGEKTDESTAASSTATATASGSNTKVNTNAPAAASSSSTSEKEQTVNVPTWTVNVIPTEALAGFDVRIGPNLTPDDFQELLDEWTDIDGVSWQAAANTLPDVVHR